jgi:hypothetical protein
MLYSRRRHLRVNWIKEIFAMWPSNILSPPSSILCDLCGLAVGADDRPTYCFPEEPGGRRGEVTIVHSKCVGKVTPGAPIIYPIELGGTALKVDLG